MSLVHLRPIRIVVSLSLLAAITMLLLDVWNVIPAWVYGALTSIQIMPALLKALIETSLWSLCVLFVVGLTIAFGRVYCSTICPMGTFQDFFIYLAKRKFIHRRYKYKKPLYGIHYGILAGVFLLLCAENAVLLNLLEPFSNYGRIVTNALRPVLALMNNSVSWLLGKFGLFVMDPVPLHHIGYGVIAGMIVFAGTVAYLSYTRGRLFCNLLCPAGALLSLLSRLTIWKITIDRKTCDDCGVCERACKANCIDAETKKIDIAACVGCFDCIAACPSASFNYEMKPVVIPVEKIEFDRQRRSILAGSASAFLGLIQTPPVVSVAAMDSLRTLRAHVDPVTPPGSKNIHHFTTLCTACHVCVSACPTQVLAPSFLEYGWSGIFQPRMDYATSYCNYDCNICTQVCPSGAILPLTVEEKKVVQMGKAVFIKDDCIVITKKKDCGACAEHCPTKAVKMVPYEKRFLPELNNDICIGCGACEHPCPTDPKAIYVEANPYHLTAQKPKIEKLEEAKPTEGFPF